jgi:23S rRNA (adenine1618-N6)-methyltransferase
VERNGWTNEIELRRNYNSSNILVGVLKDEERYRNSLSSQTLLTLKRFDFCMCNPPFFENLEQTGLSDKTVGYFVASILV